MDVDEETSRSPKDPLSLLPEDDFGSVRERRDFGPMNIALRPILPSPFRDSSFLGLTGWRYYPTAHQEDRLSLSKGLEGELSTAMTIPDSWNDRVIDHSKAAKSAQRMLEKYDTSEESKKRKTSAASSDNSQHVAISKSMSVDDLKMCASTKVAFSEEATVVTASSASTAACSQVSLSVGKPPAVELATDLVPKRELFTLYRQPTRMVYIKTNDYLTWANGKSNQNILYTSAFVCPLTKEIFLAGRYGDSCVNVGGVCWHTSKKVAEHAAAARAYDCWNMREGRQNETRLCLDMPYYKGHAPEVSIDQLPTEIREKIQEMQKKQASPEEVSKNKPVSPPRKYDDQHQARSEDVSKNKPASPPCHDDDHHNTTSSREIGFRKAYDRRQEGNWNNGRSRGRKDGDFSAYHRDRDDGRGYSTANLTMEQQRGYGSGQNVTMSTFATSYCNHPRAYCNQGQVTLDQQRVQGSGNNAIQYGDPNYVFPGWGRDGAGPQRSRNRVDQNQTSQDFARAGLQQNDQHAGPNSAYPGWGRNGAGQQRSRNGEDRNHASQDFARGGMQQNDEFAGPNSVYPGGGRDVSGPQRNIN